MFNRSDNFVQKMSKSLYAFSVTEFSVKFYMPLVKKIGCRSDNFTCNMIIFMLSFVTISYKNPIYLSAQIIFVQNAKVLYNQCREKLQVSVFFVPTWIFGKNVQNPRCTAWHLLQFRWYIVFTSYYYKQHCYHTWCGS